MSKSAACWHNVEFQPRNYKKFKKRVTACFLKLFPRFQKMYGFSKMCPGFPKMYPSFPKMCPGFLKKCLLIFFGNQVTLSENW